MQGKRSVASKQMMAATRFVLTEQGRAVLAALLAKDEAGLIQGGRNAE